MMRAIRPVGVALDADDRMQQQAHAVCPAPSTAARTVSTRNGASGTLSSSAVPAGGESITRTAIGCEPARVGEVVESEVCR